VFDKRFCRAEAHGPQDARCSLWSEQSSGELKRDVDTGSHWTVDVKAVDTKENSEIKVRPRFAAFVSETSRTGGLGRAFSSARPRIR
jgi:hypothetical protein